MIALSKNDYVLEVLPDVGGSIRSLTYKGKPVLRAAPDGATDPCDTGCFPLVPYANRIANAVFTWQDREIHLPRAFADHPHALHGDGWKTAWNVADATADRLRLTYEKAAVESWPWAYAAKESFYLDKSGLTVRLSLENRSNRPMPFSLGLHPWFVRTPATVLTAAVDGVWLSDDTMLPTETAPANHFLDLAGGAALKDSPFVDNCHTGWSGPAVLLQPDFGMKVVLSASPECTFLHVYAPVGSDFVCAEPVTAMPNAFKRPEPAAVTGARQLAPGARFAMDMTVRAEDI